MGFGGKPERYIQRAVACGSHYLTCALIPQEVDSKEKLACFAEKLSNIAHQVHLAGLTFAFHPIGSDYRLMDGVPVYKRLMDLLPKEVQLTFCVYATFGSGTDYRQVLRDYAGRLVLVHFKDSLRKPDGNEQLTPLGEGSRNWQPIAAACESSGVKWVFAEQEHYVITGSSIGMEDAGEADYWWLRSPGKYDHRAAYVDSDGVVHSDGGTASYDAFAVRPAFNLDLTSVLFTSAAVGGKSSGAVGADAIFEIGAYTGNEWKLTLLDESRNFSISDAKINEGNTVTFSYSNAQTGANEYISAIIVDNGAITHYGRILQLDGTTNGANGTASLALPEGVTLDENTKLYVFNEQYNGGANDDTKLTDYASKMIDVQSAVDTVAPTLSNGSATRDSETNATVKFTSNEAGTYYYEVVESSAEAPTIDTTGTGTSCASGENIISLTTLSGTGAKEIYIVVKDAVGNVSDKLKIAIPAIYTLTVNLNGGSGSTTGGEYPAGEVVNIDAGGRSGYRFTGWTSSNGGIFADASSPSTTFTMPAGNVTVTANFEQYYTIAVNASAGGKVDGGGDYAAGSTVKLTATPDSGYRFVRWVENGQQVSADATYTFPAEQARTLTAQFEKVYSVTVNASGGGKVTADKNTAAEGETVTLTATPSPGYRFTGWTSTNEDVAFADASSENTTFTMLGNAVTVTANFEQYYTIAVSSSGGGTATADKTMAAEGETVTLTATPDSNYRFTGWTTSNGGSFADASSASTTFTMPAGNVTITANWQYDSPYIPPTKPDGPSTGTSDGWEDIVDELADAEDGDTITIDMNGETEVPGEIFEEVAGKDVTVEFELEDGISWTVNGQDIPTGTDFTDLNLGVDLGTKGIAVDVINTVTGELGSVQITLAHDGEFGFALTLTAPLGKENAGYWANLYHYNEVGKTLDFETSAQVASDGTASLRMTHASQYAIVIDDKSHDLPFTDLGENQWYESAVRYAYTHDIMEGTSPTTFVPNTSLTRAEAVQVLYNLEGQPAVSDSTTFPDLVNGWYKPAIAWAEQTGVVDGYEDGTFRPGQPVNRMEFAQMLYNYAKYKGYDLTAQGDLTAFPDGDSVQPWAETAMTWANGNQLINGHDDGTLEPGGTTTRAQAASILMKFDQNVVEN